MKIAMTFPTLTVTKFQFRLKLGRSLFLKLIKLFQVPQEKCRQIPKKECIEVPYQVPRKIPHEICVDIPYEKCHGVPEKVPKKIPRKVSHQVKPKMNCELDLRYEWQVCEEEYGYPAHGFGNGHGGFGGFGFDGGLIGKRSDTEERIGRRSDDASEETSTKSNLLDHQHDPPAAADQ